MFETSLAAELGVCHCSATLLLDLGQLTPLAARFEVTEKMLSHFIHAVEAERSLFRYRLRPRVVVCVPSGVTGVELRAVQEAAELAEPGKPTPSRSPSRR